LDVHRNLNATVSRLNCSAHDAIPAAETLLMEFAPYVSCQADVDHILK